MGQEGVQGAGDRMLQTEAKQNGGVRWKTGSQRSSRVAAWRREESRNSSRGLMSTGTEGRGMADKTEAGLLTPASVRKGGIVPCNVVFQIALYVLDFILLLLVGNCKAYAHLYKTATICRCFYMHIRYIPSLTSPNLHPENNGDDNRLLCSFLE